MKKRLDEDLGVAVKERSLVDEQTGRTTRDVSPALTSEHLTLSSITVG